MGNSTTSRKQGLNPVVLTGPPSFSLGSKAKGKDPVVTGTLPSGHTWAQEAGVKGGASLFRIQLSIYLLSGTVLGTGNIPENELQKNY